MEGVPGHRKYRTWCEYIFSKGVKALSSLLKHDYTVLKMLIAVKEQENQRVWVQIFGVYKGDELPTCVF